MLGDRGVGVEENTTTKIQCEQKKLVLERADFPSWRVSWESLKFIAKISYLALLLFLCT
jgi:hypothetical protein